MKSNFLVTACLRRAALGLLNLMLCGSTLAANSAPPSLMSYQGFLVDANGAAELANRILKKKDAVINMISVAAPACSEVVATCRHKISTKFLRSPQWYVYCLG